MVGRPPGWGVPHAVLLGLTGIVAITLVYAGATSAVALGSYNPAWDGGAEFRSLAADESGNVTIGRETTAYTSMPAEQTLVIILTPSKAYTATDIQRINTFLDRGGTLLIADDFRPHTNLLLSRLNVPVRITRLPVRDERAYGESPAFPRAPDVRPHAYTRGVSQLTLNHPSTLTVVNNDTTADASLSTGDLSVPENTTLLANTSGFAYIDRNGNDELDQAEELRQRPVVTTTNVSNGTVIVASDPSLFLNAMLDQPGNRRFAQNLVRAHESVLLDYSHNAPQPPLAAVLITLRQSALATLIALLVVVGGVTLTGYTTALHRAWEWVTTTTRTPDSDEIRADVDALVEHLEAEHPEWDEDRIERVVTGVMANGGESASHDDE